MTKIVCVGDIHVADKPPVSCTESYTDDIIDMLKWIADYSYKHEADAVVWAGDVFHHKAPGRNSHELVLKMIDVVRYHKVPLWCVTGNHDVQNGVVDQVHARQPLGVLYAAGLRELSGWHPDLPLFGVPWRESWTEQGDPERALEGWRVDSELISERKHSLVVAHAPIYPPHLENQQMFEKVSAAELSAAMGNVGYLYYGHIHEDHGIFEVDGVTYANMGAISRGSLHEYNLNRKIKVAVWTDGAGGIEALSTPNQPGFTEVDVPHKPANEVFRLAEAVELKAGKINLETFLSEVGTRTLDISSTASVIDHIRSREDVPPPVRKRAIEILEGVE